MDSRKKKSRSSKAGNKTPREVTRPTIRRQFVYRWPGVFLPWLIAETVCREVEVFLNISLPQRYARWLTAKAEVCFQKNEWFRRHVRGEGNAGRAYLYMNMRHWLSALLGTERRDLWYCLPESFDLGHPLPPGPHPRLNRRNNLPLPRPRRWRPALVLQHPRWQWLAA